MIERRGILAGAAVLVLLAGGALVTWQVDDRLSAVGGIAPAVHAAEAKPVTAAPAAPDRELPTSAGQVQLSFAPVVKEVTPAVVNVYATKTEEGFESPFAGDPIFTRLFGPNFLQSRPRTSQSLGSGVIIDPSGVIITNSHVVNGADEIHIALSGGREYPVTLLLDDPKSDLAVLKIGNTNGRTFPALKFANSDELLVGDLVLAIGNPFGVGQTVTSGIVSALARTGVETGNFDYFIQTDASINPGNSGGALVNLSGELVGINTAIFTSTTGGGSVGIGFAIPANMARVVAEAGENGGVIVRPWFGARLQEVTTDIADSINLDVPHGALIAEVAPDSPAAKAGLKAGDVIVKIDGLDVDAPQGFEFHFATKEMGTTSDLTYVRDGRTRDAEVKVAAAAGATAERSETISGRTRFAGATVSALTPQVAQDLNLPFDSKGVVVTNIGAGSPADRMGLEKGDVIQSIDGEAINDVERFKSLVTQPVDGWQIVLQRNGETIRSYISG